MVLGRTGDPHLEHQIRIWRSAIDGDSHAKMGISGDKTNKGGRHHWKRNVASFPCPASALWRTMRYGMKPLMDSTFIFLKLDHGVKYPVGYRRNRWSDLFE
jgi:hypothetical protein